MIKQYESKLISFAYPENWTLVDGGEGIPKEISLESPEGAVWMVNAFSSNVPADEMWKEAEKSFRENYDDIEFSEFKGSFKNVPEIGYEANFYCLDFLVQSRIYIFHQAPLRMMVIHQAETRQFDQSSDVMDAITTSLLESEPIDSESVEE